MELKKILKDVDVLSDIYDIQNFDIKKLSARAQDDITQGLFFCYEGKHNMLDMAKLAIKNGAKVLVTEKKLDLDIKQIVVKDIRKAIGQIAQNFFDTKSIKVIGVTGTNGKTSTTFIIKHILEQAGKKVGVIGTNGVYFADTFIPANLTTPDPIDLHEMFSIMKKGKADYIVMEVSAHAIHLKKIEGINFVCKIFTNLTQDHLDYFKTMENYQKAKMDFFCGDDLMIINADDETGQKIIQRNINAVSYGINSPCDCFAIEVNKNGNEYILNISDNVISVKSHLYGLFNVYNSLASAVSCYFLGISIDDIQKGLQSVKQVEGRFNVFEYQGKKIIIDYAHTPDGLEKVLKTARELTDGKLYCVFGCGGNRDKSKRKIMGAVADKYSDYSFITSDNPRNENPNDIIEDIVSGFNSTNYYKIEDRASAIDVAIKSMNYGDTVIICGKGSEKYMEIGEKRVNYCDFDVVNSIIGDNYAD